MESERIKNQYNNANKTSEWEKRENTLKKARNEPFRWIELVKIQMKTEHFRLHFNVCCWLFLSVHSSFYFFIWFRKPSTKSHPCKHIFYVQKKMHFNNFFFSGNKKCFFLFTFWYSRNRNKLWATIIKTPKCN